MTDNNKNKLNVWFGTELVGQLWQNETGQIGFVYNASWRYIGFGISQQLPSTHKLYPPEEGKAHQFFVNLLPEAGARDHIVRELKISNSDFELLKAVGGECAGALSILPVDYPVSEIFDYKKDYKQLTDEDLRRLIARKGSLSGFKVDGDRPRLSLAGAQDKCPIFYEEGHYFLPINAAAASSHILKFEIIGYSNIPIYEYFLTKIAAYIGLPVVDVELKQKNHDYFLLIKRYDRSLMAQSKIARLHQEDFCQALGFSYKKKYEQEGGPTFQDCYRLIQKVSVNPIEDRENLLKWQVFNWLAGNSDGHAKNLALIYDDTNQPRLAPFYDLVCTRAIEGIDSKLAFSIDGEFNPDKINLHHIKLWANQCNVSEEYLIELIKEMAIMLAESIHLNHTVFSEFFEKYPVLQRVRAVILKQTKKILRQI